jgi:hypothetical protein
MSDTNTICGRHYVAFKLTDPHPPKTFWMTQVTTTDDNTGEKVKKKIKKERKSFYRKPGTRYVVDGIFHPGGIIPIRFKSLQKAENHIRNFRLQRDGIAPPVRLPNV